MLAFDPETYGPVLAPLLAIDRRRPLDGGTPQRETRPLLDSLSIATSFAHAPRVTDRNMAACCLAGVWLLHDYLDESHTISQSIDTTTGSFWHGIMHRREGDFSNAKYWFRRVGDHPVFAQLADSVGTAAKNPGFDTGVKLPVHEGIWDPYAFVDLCQEARRNPSTGDLCLDLQQLEWEHLFDYCYRNAIA